MLSSCQCLFDIYKQNRTFMWQSHRVVGEWKASGKRWNTHRTVVNSDHIFVWFMTALDYGRSQTTTLLLTIIIILVELFIAACFNGRQNWIRNPSDTIDVKDPTNYMRMQDAKRKLLPFNIISIFINKLSLIWNSNKK